jgi:hypothetical protein
LSVALRVGGGPTFRNTMASHLPLLVGSDAHLGLGHGQAKQDKTFRLIFREVCVRMVVFNRSIEQASSTGKATTLVTDRRQDDSVGSGYIPDVFVFSAVKVTEALRGFQRNPKAPRLCHLKFDALGIIEAAILAVWRLSRFAAAEVS